eukprot:TRINITY_DN4968_c0_g1_i2.p1 TRINITY_DN4968_c0_g1~~TRINITY_DN4968_c0_g1_i2.p1  ORF type:complete len:107 (-),score=17.99 TRINITY_DN4968_c0_g1_i2:83-403(-)
MLKRNIKVKLAPGTFQDTPKQFDFIISFEERVFDIITEVFSERPPLYDKPVCSMKAFPLMLRNGKTHGAKKNVKNPDENQRKLWITTELEKERLKNYLQGRIRKRI